MRRLCVNCRRNIRKKNEMGIECRCEIDGHYISYVANFTESCRRWAKAERKEHETLADTKA